MSNTAERLLRVLDDRAQLLGRRVALDRERAADLGEAVAVGVVEAEAAAHVHVALEGRGDLGQADLAGRRAVDERRRQARGERVQQVLGRVRAGVGAEQHGGLAGVEQEGLACGSCPPRRRREALDGGAVVGAVEPLVGGAEGERAELGLGADRVQRPEHLLRVDPVADRGGSVVMAGRLPARRLLAGCVPGKRPVGAAGTTGLTANSRHSRDRPRPAGRPRRAPRTRRPSRATRSCTVEVARISPGRATAATRAAMSSAGAAERAAGALALARVHARRAARAGLLGERARAAHRAGRARRSSRARGPPAPAARRRGSGRRWRA